MATDVTSEQATHRGPPSQYFNHNSGRDTRHNSPLTLEETLFGSKVKWCITQGACAASMRCLRNHNVHFLSNTVLRNGHCPADSHFQTSGRAILVTFRAFLLQSHKVGPVRTTRGLRHVSNPSHAPRWDSPEIRERSTASMESASAFSWSGSRFKRTEISPGVF